MPKKRFGAEQIVALLRQIEVLVARANLRREKLRWSIPANIRRLPMRRVET